MQVSEEEPEEAPVVAAVGEAAAPALVAAAAQ